MEQDKAKLLSDLYAIRATMSLIAENDDEAAPNRTAIKNLQDQQQTARNKIEQMERGFSKKFYDQRENVYENIRELEEKCREIERKKGNAESSLKWKKEARPKNVEQKEKLEIERAEAEKPYNQRMKLVTRSFAYAVFRSIPEVPAVCIVFVMCLIYAVGISVPLAGVWISLGLFDDNVMGYVFGALANFLAFLVLFFILVCIPVAAYRRRNSERVLKKLEEPLNGIDRKIKYHESEIARIEQEEIENEQTIRDCEQELSKYSRELETCKKAYDVYNECLCFSEEKSYGSYKNGDKKYDICTFDRVTAAEYGIREIDTTLEEYDAELAKLKQSIKDAEEKKKPYRARVLESAKKTALIVANGRATYPVIDFRDWANVDLLIYYFETGRADGLKESLQLVDRQRQTEALAKAIAMASAEICRTVRESTRQLGMALEQSFSLLSSQIARQHVQTLMSIGQLENSIGQLGNSMQEMSAAQSKELRALREQSEAEMRMQERAQDMNRALLAKISVSSDHLAKQMDRQMKEVYGVY